jgi:processive 1,2-diacylglycerol beta-glucosyltransferase
MKILILSVTAGEGHNSTAKALHEAFEERGHTSDVLDTYKYVSDFLGAVMAKGYLAATKNAKQAFSGFYKLAEKRKSNSDAYSAMRFVNTVVTKKVHAKIEEYNPDVIFITHTFLGVVLDQLKQKGLCNAPVLGIVTDFTVHPYWEEALYIDYIITANEFLTKAAIKKGFEASQVLPLGIPVRKKFANVGDKAAARRALGITEDKPCALVMGGSMGYGHMSKTIAKLEKADCDFTILAVCGRNAKAKENVEKAPHKKDLRVFGFVENIDALMDAADFIITKPGGLTSSEALAKRLPMILCDPIPGHEVRNEEFLVSCGCALAEGEFLSVDEAVERLLLKPERLEYMRSCIDLIRKPNSAFDICNFIERL